MKRRDDTSPVVLIVSGRMGMKTDWTWRRYAKTSVKYKWGRAVFTLEGWEVQRFSGHLESIRRRVVRVERILTGIWVR